MIFATEQEQETWHTIYDREYEACRELGLNHYVSTGLARRKADQRIRAGGNTEEG